MKKINICTNNYTNNLNNNCNTNYNDNSSQLFLIDKNKSKMESNIFFYRDVGSFGVVIYDDNNIIYKVFEITTSQNEQLKDTIEKNNLVELIMLKNFPKCKNIIQSNFTYYYDNNYDKKQGIKIGVIQPTIYQKCPWIIKDSSLLIFNKLKMYKGNLYSLINKNNIYFVRKNFLLIAKQLLNGLGQLHSYGLVHGDLKSSNILYNFSLESEQVVLIDFGGVKPSDTKEYFRTCTLTYRCPEDILYESDVNIVKYNNSGFKSDIWSLGIIFAEMLLGYNPITLIYSEYKKKNISDDEIELELSKEFQKVECLDVVKLLRNRIKELSDYQEQKLFDELIRYAEVVNKMLMVNPDSRISSVQEVYKEIVDDELDIYEPSYNYNYENLLTEHFLDFRTLFYEKVINLYLKISFNVEHGLPFLVDLLDRFFSRYNKYNKIDDMRELELEAIGLSMVYLTLIWFLPELPSYIQIEKKVKFRYLTFEIIKDYILQVLVFMDYDIYRPWFNLCETNDFKLIVLNNLKNKITGLRPEFYR
jgi:serine/threonine protein kinase